MKKLEGYKVFPIIAWTLICGFALFVYQLTVGLQDERNNLSEQTSSLEDALKDPFSI